MEYIPLNDNHIKYLEKNDEGDEESRERGEYTALNGLGSVVTEEGTGKKYLACIVDMMGRMRVLSQIVKEGTARWVGYSLCYIVLVLETLFFVWTYLKRVLYLAFLTLISPLIAVMYPIDKISDGRAQAFESWLKEYIFNLLIQPLHLLLYTILISAAFELAIVNVVYAVVAVGFMMPAEKLMRNFFGFNKAKTPGALGGAAGAALAFTGLQKVIGLGKHKGGNRANDKEGKDNTKIKFSNSEGVNAKGTVANSFLNNNGKTAGGNTGGAKEKGKEDNNKIRMAEPKAKAQEVATGTKVRYNLGTTGKQSDKGIVKKGAESKKQSAAKKRKINVVKAAAGRYKRTIGKRMANRIKKMRPIRALARGATGIAGAATLGMAGLALGIASGDASKAFQYTTAGVAGGYGAGKALGGSVADAMYVNPEKINDEMQMAYYGEDYKKIKFEESVQEMAHDDKNIDTIRKLTGLSYEESQAVLGSVGRRCYESGITNMDDIAAVYQMEQQGNSRDEAIAALKFNKYLPADLDKMGEEDRNDHIARWTREYEEAGYENPEQLAKTSMELAEKINKIKSQLKKA